MSTTATPLFPWTKNLETGHPPIDQQHQQLVSYLNDLADAMRAGQGKAVLTTLLDKLVAYTDQHFRHEEMLMLSRQYPQSLAHKVQHDFLKKKVLEFSRAFKNGEPVDVLEVLEFLKDWLKSHIGGSDRRLGEYLTSRR